MVGPSTPLNSQSATSSCSIDDYIAHHVPLVRQGSDVEGRFIFSKAILLPHSAAAEFDNSPYAASHLVLSAVIFNLALAHHFLGEQQMSTAAGKILLAKAAKLYELGFKLQERRETESPVYYMMSALNNTGQVYRLLGEEMHAQQCFTHLLSIFMIVLHQTKDTREASEAGHPFTFLEDGFLRNISYLILGNEEASAPAA